MPSSRRTMRASSEAIIPSRAYGPMPPDRTRMRPSRPRSASVFSSSARAITLRHVLAWQTTRLVLATRVAQRPIVGATAGDPGLQHFPELRAHWIDAADRHRSAANREVVRRQLSGAREVTLGGVTRTVAREPLRQSEFRPRLLIERRRQRLQPARLARGEPGRLAARPGPHG